jgi:NAD(P)-dependent dehydrogenase (short-subunit alcohol dehydrogenase family)
MPRSSAASTPRSPRADLLRGRSARHPRAKLRAPSGQRLGGVAVLVNNAANDDRHDWRNMTPEYFDNRINTNLRHYFFAINTRPTDDGGGIGSIINIGSSSYR